MEGVTERHLPKRDDSVVGPVGELADGRFLERKILIYKFM